MLNLLLKYITYNEKVKINFGILYTIIKIGGLM